MAAAAPGTSTPMTTSSSSALPDRSADTTQPTTHSDVGSSKGSSLDPATAFAVDLSGYVFNNGFCHQEWADVQVSFFSTSLKLHRLILARSPYLAHLLMNSMPGGSVQLLVTDENITEEAVYIAIQHLYISPSNARAVLATACLFSAMPDLEGRAYTVLSESISSSNVADLLNWLSARIPAATGGGNGANGFASSNGASGSSASGWDTHAPTPAYGNWPARLHADALDFLLHTLPAQLTASAAEGVSLAADPRLLAAYAPLPFDLFKHVVESPELPISFIQDRFGCCKRVIAARKKLAVAQGAGPSQYEETVVLALKSDGDGMQVHITRKPKRSRAPLWKTEG